MASGYVAWYLNGQYHREDGPAVEYANGDKEWYLNDEKLTEEEHNQKMSKSITADLDGASVTIAGTVYRLKKMD